jgi:hypothetical protein
MARRRFTIVTISLLVLGLIAAPAAATHVHGSQLPNGECVLLAADGGEKFIQLPQAADEYPSNRQHPLHTNVHLGVPGTEAQPGTIFVAIDDDGSLTQDAMDLCGGEFVNSS